MTLFAKQFVQPERRPAVGKAAQPQSTGEPGTPIAASATSGNMPALVTRFGSKVDVRNRGAIRIRRLAGANGIGPNAINDDETPLAPAVVRLWHADSCDELTIPEARALAAQLLAAAALADGQNRR